MRKKIAIFGAGNVGASLSQLIVQSNIADLALVDILKDLAMGKALDLAQAKPVYGSDVEIIAGSEPELIKGSELVVITAGATRKPGMTREQLLETNARICAQCARAIKKHTPGAIVIVVSNPLDAMTYLCAEITGFDKSRVIGMAGVLDSARLKLFLADALGASVKDIQAMVLGGHGDQMVPVLSYSSWQGERLERLLSKSRLKAIIERTKNAGAEIVSKLGSSAYYSPSASCFEMIKAILSDEKRLLACSAWLKGEYGLKGIYLGVPIILGKNGVEKVVELKLNSWELRQLKKSADTVFALINQLKKIKL